MKAFVESFVCSVNETLLFGGKTNCSQTWDSSFFFNSLQSLLVDESQDYNLKA